MYQQLLRPVPAVMARVSAALTSSSSRGSVGQWPRLLVGVHVRSHDDRHDWPVVAPQVRRRTTVHIPLNKPAGSIQSLSALTRWRGVGLPVSVHARPTITTARRPSPSMT